MSGVKLLTREDGVYVENPKLDRDFIDNLMESLEYLGSFDFEESDLVSKIKSSGENAVKVSESLPPNHDAGITFSKSPDNPSQIIATIIPQKGTGKPLTLQEINDRIDLEGYSSISIIPDNLLGAIKKQSSETEKFSFVIGEYPPPIIKIDKTADGMTAYVSIKKYRDGQCVYVEDILKALSDANIVKGILNDKIVELSMNNSSVESVEIAKGLRPVDGENGEIIYHFDAKKEKKGPEIDCEGKADYHHLNLFENVKKGDLLCQLIPPIGGKPGYKVTGEEMPAKPGRECMMPQGQNTEIDPNDSLKLIASIDGCPKLAGGRVIVDPLMNIRGDIGVGTGDIDFVGTVQISGGIMDGYTVRAKGDILVNGPCESAHIIADGNIILQKGLRSNENAVIKAGGEVHAAFLEGVNIEAGGDVIIRDYCYHCIIKSGKSVQVIGKKGFITGGKVEAKDFIISRRLGSNACPRTEILIDPWSGKDEQQETEKIEVVNSDSIMQSEKPLQSKTIQSDDIQNEKKGEQREMPYVAVIDSAHPNVLIIINGAKVITKEEIAGVKFVNKLGRIEMFSYEHVEKQE